MVTIRPITTESNADKENNTAVKERGYHWECKHSKRKIR